jgi:hypothetical protein
MRKIIWMTILAAGLFSAPGAFADANLCNATRKPIWTGYGEYQVSSSNWIAGWYFVEPGQCATPLVGDVCFWWAWVWSNCASRILYFGENADGEWWGGSNGDSTLGLSICTTQNAFYESPQLSGKCPRDRSWLLWSTWQYSAPADSVTITFNP